MTTRPIARLRNLTIAVALAGAVAAPAAASALKKFKDWDKSPEAYFLSKAEREKWVAVDSDETAEKFVTNYRAARGKGFDAAIRSRIEFADKSFKAGKKKGSETLRGRMLIVFGPPTSAELITPGTAPKKEKADYTAGEPAATGLDGGGRGGSEGVGNPMSNVGGSGQNSLSNMRPSEDKPATTRWTWDAKAVPAALKLPSLSLDVSVDPANGKETVADPAKLDEMLGAVVEFWAPKPAPASP